MIILMKTFHVSRTMQKLAIALSGLESGHFRHSSKLQMTSSTSGLMRRNLFIVKVLDGSYVHH